MLVKPVTSLALCVLALTVAAPVGAAEATATVVVAPAAVPSGTIVKVVHRSRKTTNKKKVVVKVIEHHAEPAKTPVVPPAVLTTHLTLTKASVKKEPPPPPPPPPSKRSHAHAKAEVMIGPKVDAKVVVAPAKPASPKPPAAVIEVKTEPAHPLLKGSEVKLEVKPVKGTSVLRPVAEKEVEEAPTDARIALDVGTGSTKVIAPASATVSEPKAKEHGKVAVKPPCMHEGVEFIRGQEAQTFALTRCDGSVAPLAVERLSVLARPDSAPIPKSVEVLAKAKGPDLAPGVRRVDAGLVERVEAIAEHFAKAGPAKVSVISGYRPMSSGSYHATAQALDMRIEGVPNEAVVEFCKTLADTGCGYYPNSSFVHVDVRQPGTGHVAWIDASGPGEPPRYVASWPPPPDPDVKVADKTEENVVEKLDKELPPLPVDEHPAAPSQAAVLSTPLELAK
jgi:uncharacterized protein DUF882